MFFLNPDIIPIVYTFIHVMMHIDNNNFRSIKNYLVPKFNVPNYATNNTAYRGYDLN